MVTYLFALGVALPIVDCVRLVDIAGLRPILLGGAAGTVVGTSVGFLAPIVSVPVELGRRMVCVNTIVLSRTTLVRHGLPHTQTHFDHH
jgi:hypothetical protein